MNNKKVNPCIPIQPNTNLRPGSILKQGNIYYQVKDNNTACVIGVAPTRTKRKKVCPEICMTGAINYNLPPRQSEPCSPNRQALKNGTLSTFYSNTITPTAGTSPFNFSIPGGGGQLPPDMNINALTGVISGTPIQASIYNFTILITDANGCTGTQDFSIQVLNPA